MILPTFGLTQLRKLLHALPVFLERSDYVHVADECANGYTSYVLLDPVVGLLARGLFLFRIHYVGFASIFLFLISLLRLRC